MSSPTLRPAADQRPARRQLRTLLVALLTSLLAATLAVVGPTTLARAQATIEVRIGSTLDPATVTVVPGTTITWINADGERHRVRATAGPTDLDSGNLEPGERFSHTFAVTGTTTYVDDRDRDDVAYHGRVVVSDEPEAEPSPGSTTEPSGPETVVVSMSDRRFSPSTLSITTGDTVRFLNDDDRQHTATADGGDFDSGILAAGQAYDRTFTRAGTFTYLCLLHPDMTGTIAVAEAGGAAPPPVPSPTPAPSPAPAPSTGGSDTAAPARVEVEMRDFAFAPATVEVAAGSTVIFRNGGRALHTATASDGSFDSDLVSPGDAYERRFDRAGTFAYTCLLHPEMTGRIVVTDTDGAVDGSTGGASGRRGTSGAGTGSTPERSPSSVLVSLRDFAFAPSEVRVRAGDTVRFRNDGDALHTATARDGSYDSGLLRPGGVADRTFRTAGTYAFWCTLHPDMVATIRVAAADGAVPAQAPDGTQGTATEGGETAARGAEADPPEGPVDVSVVDDAFLPDVVEVAAGQEVVWTNDGEAVHTVTAADGSFDSGLVTAGGGFRQRFDSVGTFAYLCTVHPGMTGEVRVVAAGDVTAAPAPDGADGSLGARAAASGDGLSVAVLEVLMLGLFAVALAGFTVLSGRMAARDRPAR